jgi:hypothetical protein
MVTLQFAQVVTPLQVTQQFPPPPGSLGIAAWAMSLPACVAAERLPEVHVPALARVPLPTPSGAFSTRTTWMVKAGSVVVVLGAFELTTSLPTSSETSLPCEAVILDTLSSTIPLLASRTVGVKPNAFPSLSTLMTLPSVAPACNHSPSG